MMGGGFMNSFGGPGAGIFWLIGPIIMAVFWGFFIVLIVLSIRWLVTQGTAGTTTARTEPETVPDVLKKAYASGQINAEEYEERKKTLGL